MTLFLARELQLTIIVSTTLDLFHMFRDNFRLKSIIY